MTAATKTAKTSTSGDIPDAPESIREQLLADRRAALATWNGWVDSGRMPPPLQLLEIGTVLGLTRPGDELEKAIRAKKPAAERLAS